MSKSRRKEKEQKHAVLSYDACGQICIGRPFGVRMYHSETGRDVYSKLK